MLVVNKNLNPKEYDRIETELIPLVTNGGSTLMAIQLITGKTHQIRAHLASIGHPILCDYKYGDRKLNDNIKATYGVSEQLLHAYRLVFPKLKEPFTEISERTVQTDFPARFRKLGIHFPN